MTETYPLWVREEAARRAESAFLSEKTIVDYPLGRALCRLIMETMKEPADPLLEEAVRLTEEKVDLNSFRHKGQVADHWAVRLALKSIKRGMELAREQDQ